MVLDVIPVVNYGIPAIMWEALLDQVTASRGQFQKKPKRGKLNDLAVTGIRSYRIFEKFHRIRHIPHF